jgi:hypothetical protein
MPRKFAGKIILITMTLIRFLPIILADVLLAAHFLRFSGIFPAALVLLLLVTLFIRRYWVVRLWQALMFIATLVWIDTAIKLIRLRLALDLPWLRLAVILALVILLTIFAGFWMESKKIKAFYRQI